MDPAIISVSTIAGVVAIAALIASVCTCVRFKKQLTMSSEDKASIDIENEVTKEQTKDGTKITKKQKIHIDKVDLDNVNQITQMHQTLPNETATKIGSGAMNVLGGLNQKNITDGASTLASVGKIALSAVKGKLKDKKDEDNENKNSISPEEDELSLKPKGTKKIIEDKESQHSETEIKTTNMTKDAKNEDPKDTKIEISTHQENNDGEVSVSGEDGLENV